jgi:hypothetical protein
MMAVYLDIIARPSAAPAASHRRPSVPSIAFHASVIVSAQKNRSGESGKPAAETGSATGMNVKRITAQTAAASP